MNFKHSEREQQQSISWELFSKVLQKQTVIKMAFIWQLIKVDYLSDQGHGRQLSSMKWTGVKEAKLDSGLLIFHGATTSYVTVENLGSYVLTIFPKVRNIIYTVHWM